MSKIVRLPDGGLFAGAGDAPAIKRLQRWAEGGFDKKKPRFNKETEVDVILVKADGTAWMIDRDCEPEQITDAFTAIGSGGPYAIGAMARGATAIEAVEIAAMYDSGTSIPVESIEL